MKKFLSFCVVIIFILFYNSCTKDQAKPPVPISCNGINTDSNTYNLRISAYLETYCGSGRGCHDASNYLADGGSILIDDYQSTKVAFQNRKGLCAIKHEQGCIAMPDSPYPKLADSLITYIQCWADNGYPQ